MEIGKYVRTEEGYILENTTKGHKYIIEHLEKEQREYKNKFGKIVKHSENIVDLIVAGDLINKQKTIRITRPRQGEIIACLFKDNEGMICETFTKDNISTIMTKERYEQNCYELEE